MQKMTNREVIEGRIYQHDLVLKTVANATSPNFGKPFIQGTLEIATDEDALNVVKIHYTYVAEKTKNGGNNKTFTDLKKVIDENKTWINVGKDAAQLISVTPSIALNDFYINDNGEERAVAEKRNEGGFVNFITSLNEDVHQRTKFTTDMVITAVRHIDANPERHIDADYCELHGAIFNFRNDLLPVTFVIRDTNGMAYFENEEITPSTPLFTQVWGEIVNTSKVEKQEVASAFGNAAVRETRRTVKEYLVTGARKIPYDFGDENVLTAQDLVKAQQDRETHLAEVKKKQDEYKAQKAAQAAAPVTSTPSAATVAAGQFNF